MELSEDSVKRKENVLICDKDGNSLEQHVYVEIKSELEEPMLESNYTENSLSDSYCSDDIKVEEHTLQCSPFPLITEQTVKKEIKKESNETDSDKDVNLQIGSSTEICLEKHYEKIIRCMKTSKLLSNIDKQILYN
uniref:Uncharacterized protein LOC114342585 n=1 Tax=Diabrotica virgifera virgifera TaxID=50390 RepID=A0A6P7GHB1_DIAVI